MVRRKKIYTSEAIDGFSKPMVALYFEAVSFGGI